jgi:ABC-type antimicrobial peptide transport system permease subunit
MRALGETLAREFGNNHGIDVRSLYEVVVGNIRTPLRVLLGAVFLVLVIACANVANLLLAAGLARRRELAIRLALGASQRELAQQLVIEGLVLAFAGGVLGVLLALWAVRTFVALAGTLLPRAATVQIDGRVLGFSAAVTVLVGVLCGLWPLIRLRTRELAGAVREADTRTGSGTGGRFGNGLVVAEIALAYALLVGAGLLVKNLALLQGRDAGIKLSALTSLFGALAALLAMVGVYGVTAYNVRRQRREYGIRLALGADSIAVQKLVLARGVLVAVTGVALGAFGAFLLTRTLQAMLNDVKPTDPIVFASNAALVMVVSLVACYLPARTAGRVDPMVVLRDS